MTSDMSEKDEVLKEGLKFVIIHIATVANSKKEFFIFKIPFLFRLETLVLVLINVNFNQHLYGYGKECYKSLFYSIIYLFFLLFSLKYKYYLNSGIARWGWRGRSAQTNQWGHFQKKKKQ